LLLFSLDGWAAGIVEVVVVLLIALFGSAAWGLVLLGIDGWTAGIVEVAVVLLIALLGSTAWDVLLLRIDCRAVFVVELEILRRAFLSSPVGILLSVDGRAASVVEVVVVLLIALVGSATWAVLLLGVDCRAIFIVEFVVLRRAFLSSSIGSLLSVNGWATSVVEVVVVLFIALLSD
jgi:hypothetical protein